MAGKAASRPRTHAAELVASGGVQRDRRAHHWLCHRAYSGPRNVLTGTYRLISSTRKILDTGEVLNTWGKNPKGFITYGKDRRMLVLIVRDDRPKPGELAGDLRLRPCFRSPSRACPAETGTTQCSRIARGVDSPLSPLQQSQRWGPLVDSLDDLDPGWWQ